MAMHLIAGSFRITGAQPDGDSIRFTPDDPANWDLIRGSQVKRNASGAAQLRLDAIDALETHYGTPRTHQPLDLGRPCRDLMAHLRSHCRRPVEACEVHVERQLHAAVPQSPGGPNRRRLSAGL
jgi:hypothetical protein